MLFQWNLRERRSVVVESCLSYPNGALILIMILDDNDDSNV